VGDAPLATLGYLAAASLFILGIKLLSSPATARRGNLFSMAGMAIALVTAGAQLRMHNWQLILPGVAAGTVVSTVVARRVRMTAMPQMVALFNGMGGGAAALIGTGDYRRLVEAGNVPASASVAIVASCLIGSVSFAGSLVAFAKLQELMSGRPLMFPLQKPLNAALLTLLLGLAAWVVAAGSVPAVFGLYVAGALLLGVLVVIPVGGADMPVIISLLNSCTGLAAAATGFVLGNEVLVVSGALVGASGAILTRLMSEAMNRSLANVLFGGVGVASGTLATATSAGDRAVRSASVEDVAALLTFARSVVIVPGFGMAVARAQHALKELADALEARRVEVKFAIHPVAGRMPGHMNVLLAEANVPYSQLYDMDDINPDFDHTDVSLIIGANDVVNPAARSDAGSPIYGMPILDVDHADHIVVVKRSMATGFAGVDNPLFYNPKTAMLFGDARESVAALVAEVKRLLAAA